MMSVSVAGIQKNRCRTTIAERMGETRAELPFTGDQVGLFRAQPGRPKQTCNPSYSALGFGAGIAQGYATLGQIGFSERSGYTAIGTVCNVAARLCAEANDGQILLSQRVNVALKGSVATEQLGPLSLKGLTQPVIAYNVPFVV